MKTLLPVTTTESTADSSAGGSFRQASSDSSIQATLDASVYGLLEISNPDARLADEQPLQGPVELEHLEDQGCIGQALQQDGSEVALSAGSWLAAAIRTIDDLARIHPPAKQGQTRLLERFSLPENGSVDLLICSTSSGGDLQLRQRLPDLASRRIRHDLSNQVNSTKINAELVRVLAQRSNDDRLTAAAKRILDDCAKASAYQKDELPALIAQSPRSYEAVPSIKELVSLYTGVGGRESAPVSKDASRRATLKIQVPQGAQVTASWLSCVGSFFQRVAVSLASPPDFNPELNPTTDGITLHLEVDDDQAPASENSLTVLVDAEWERGRHQHGSLCALNSAVGPFRLLAEPGSLQFRGGL